jgi:N utilization substance protein B
MYASRLNGEDILSNLDTLGISERLTPEIGDWVTTLAGFIENNRSEIDGSIEETLENWTLERLNILTLLILEQAVAECWFMEIPPSVATDEALRLANEFEGQDAPRFINGILDRILFSGNSADRSADD